MTETKKYWKGLEELKQEPEFEKRKNQEFPEHLPFDEGILKENGIAADRRDFLKMFGFGIAAVSLASCEIPVKKAIPYLNKPEEITPGVANWYASTYSQGGDYCSILVKTREGRPIKIEGNDLSPLTKGGVQSKTHASVLELYDVGRLTGPQKDGADTDWDTVDSELRAELTKIKGIGGEVVILSSTIISPSTKAVIDNFLNVHDNARHITYDAVSYYGMLKANQDCFDKAVIPNYHFEKANVILSIGADFL
ncbi:MAG: TAT-variant-translocated molybdopterin oxidoreductase, partial [Bacteroidia bacterium]|nr:TAT-variant-translocated molybdopterin oxidoreductase [Bacteroidia bacterium]